MSRIKNGAVPIILFVLFILYAIGRIFSSLPAINRPRELADTEAYLRISRESLFDEDFWAGTRPLMFPLLLKITNQDLRLASAVQLGFSILAWGSLAWIVSRFLRPPLMQIVAFGWMLALSLDRHISGWDFVMMSESLSLSLLAMFIGISLWLLEGWRTYKVVLMLGIGFLLAFSRDTNAWLLLIFAVLLSIAVLFRLVGSKTMVIISGLAAIFLVSTLNANKGYRWVFPLGNVIGQRILPYGSSFRYFENCGMPVSPRLIDLAGQFANAQERALFEDPELEPFRHWLMDKGRACYMLWLGSHPVESLRDVFVRFDELVSFSSVDGYFSRAYDPLLPVALGKFFYPECFSLGIWILTTLAALYGTWHQFLKDNRLWAGFIFINLCILPHLFISWQGDAMAPARHALAVGVQLYLSFTLFGILTLERFWVARNKEYSVVK
jgi:hypothetical protein